MWSTGPSASPDCGAHRPTPSDREREQARGHIQDAPEQRRRHRHDETRSRAQEERTAEVGSIADDGARGAIALAWRSLELARPDVTRTSGGVHGPTLDARLGPPMPHPLLGLPPADVTAGSPRAAARLRADRARIAEGALRSTLHIDPTFAERHDELALRRLLRDEDRHIEQLARALETGEERFVTEYGEHIIPVYRRRGIRMNDYATILAGLREAVLAALPAVDAPVATDLIERWTQRVRHHRRLPGDHKGNALVRFIWKGAGLGDDTLV